MPKEIDEALMEICEETRKQGSRVWFDAEQTALQPGVDEWALEMMRRWNRNGEAVLYNTIQGYLKASEANADRHIALAAKEGWTVAIKLVRGAYIESEPRHMIHDTKEDTDINYDIIADKLITQKLPPYATAQGLKFPPSALMLATHNSTSTSKASASHRAMVEAGLPTCMLDCAQVVGMADELSCELVSNYERHAALGPTREQAVPKAFKCLTWGSVGECFGYLHRRAIENQGAVTRTRHMVMALRRELWNRILG